MSAESNVTSGLAHMTILVQIKLAWWKLYCASVSLAMDPALAGRKRKANQGVSASNRMRGTIPKGYRKVRRPLSNTTKWGLHFAFASAVLFPNKNKFWSHQFNGCSCTPLDKLYCTVCVMVVIVLASLVLVSAYYVDHEYKYQIFVIRWSHSKRMTFHIHLAPVYTAFDTLFPYYILLLSLK